MTAVHTYVPGNVYRPGTLITEGHAGHVTDLCARTVNLVLSTH